MVRPPSGRSGLNTFSIAVGVRHAGYRSLPLKQVPASSESSFPRRCPAIDDGDRFRGQVRAFSGSFREPRGRGDDGTRNGVDAGRTRRGADSLLPGGPPETSMVRRGSTVRVRQRALAKVPANRHFVVVLHVEHADTFRTHLWYARRTSTSRDVFRARLREARSRRLPRNVL